MSIKNNTWLQWHLYDGKIRALDGRNNLMFHMMLIRKIKSTSLTKQSY